MTGPGWWRDRTNALWGDDWPRVRDLWPLDPGVAHCNHGSFGAVPTPVLAAQREWQDRMNANPVRFFRRHLPGYVARAREDLAARLGADPAGFALVPNVTTGVSAVLANVPLRAGDEVLVTDHGYGSARLAVERACARAGARLATARVPLAAGADEVVARVAAAAGPRTRLAILDHVTSTTARLFPVAALAGMLRERGVAVLVDGAHAPGMLELDLACLGADFWTGNFHKWACAPRGCAGLYVAPPWRERMRSLVVSWNDARGFPAAFDQAGTTDLSAWLAAPDAFDLLGKLGWDRLRAHNSALAATGHRLVAEAVCADLAALPADGAVPMRVVPLPAELGGGYDTAYELSERITARTGVEVNVAPWRGSCLLRVSAQAYNAPADYRRLAEGLPAAYADPAGEVGGPPRT
jgi:isopenicillin-N epimerase